MKRFLNIFLVVSMFFNLGFAFSGVKASIVPVPLRYDSSALFYPSPIDPSRVDNDLTVYLNSFFLLESLHTAFILKQAQYYEYSKNLDFSKLGIKLEDYNSDFYVKNYDNKINSLIDSRKNDLKKKIFHVEKIDIVAVGHRIREIDASIKASNERVYDINESVLYKLSGGLTEERSVSGIPREVNNIDLNKEVKIEKSRSIEYKEYLKDSKIFYEELYESLTGEKFSNEEFCYQRSPLFTISNNIVFPGSTIRLISNDRRKLKDAFLIKFKDTPYLLKSTDIVSDNEISVNLPEDIPINEKGFINFTLFDKHSEDIAMGVLISPYFRDNFVKITSSNVDHAKPGDTISLLGEGLDKADAVTISSRINNMKIVELSSSNIISKNRIDIVLPDFQLKAIPNSPDHFYISVHDRNGGVSSIGIGYDIVSCNLPPTCQAPLQGCSYINIPKDANGCVTGCGTLSCPTGDTCKCPSGQVYLTVGGTRKCAVLNTGSVSCSRYGSHPVCGCDGNTYQNSCYALINGLKTYTDGACQ